MTDVPIYIAGMGVVSSVGCGLTETINALRVCHRGLAPVTLFAAGPDGPLPVGQVGLTDTAEPSDSLPRTHHLACMAAEQALAASPRPPDAIVLGVTTGGMFETETLLKNSVTAPQHYVRHGLGTVGEELARRWDCSGPVITLSTACASGATAIILAMELLRSGMAERVLAGGVDGLCRLTYFGFKSLQLIDPDGAHPLDAMRRGMSIGEGAALLLLTREAPQADALQILGGGLSCDAHHPTAPHPTGDGALAAMQAALQDAQITANDIDYINLHGTGTLDNDRSEALALNALFGSQRPPLSSTKGVLGHTLAAAGAIEAVIAALSIQQGLIPPNVGFKTPDAELNLVPVATPLDSKLSKVLTNSFGFGGNNAALVIGTGHQPQANRDRRSVQAPLTVTGYACLSGAGLTDQTLEAFIDGRPCNGRPAEELFCEKLPLRTIRRLKRLPKQALALALAACNDLSDAHRPTAISLGTGWGALSETHDFLERLFETGTQFPSPFDFIGSVHNAPAGQIALMLRSKCANVTTSGGDYSFEQALLSADLLTRSTAEPILVLGVDEGHPKLSPLFDSSVDKDAPLSDGGGALLLKREQKSAGICIELIYYQSASRPGAVPELVSCLDGPGDSRRDYGAVLVGLPAICRSQANEQMEAFVAQTGFDGPVIDYRRQTGQFATASAVAAVVAVKMAKQGLVAAPLADGKPVSLKGKGVLLLGLGPFITAIRIGPR